MPWPPDELPDAMVGLGERLLGRRDEVDGVQNELAVVAGDTYLERGRPVVVVVRARPAPAPPGRRSAPRNVLIRRECGTLVVRPFRGLRRPK